MAGRRYLLESSTIDGYLLEDGSGVLILQDDVAPTTVLNTTDATAFGTDTTPTLEFTGTDAAPGNDIRHTVHIHTAPFSVVCDSYSETNRDSDAVIGGGSGTSIGQSFTGNGGTLTSAQFFLSKSGTPPSGLMAVRIYAHAGTFGTNGTPTGSSLALSGTVNITTLTATPTLTTFTFTGVNEITLTATTKYFVVLQYGEGLNDLLVGIDTTSPGHGGNYWDDSILDEAGRDVCFYVNTQPTPLLNKISGTDGGFVVSDTFNDNAVNTSFWTPFGLYSESGQQMTLSYTSGTTNYAGVETVARYDFTGRYIKSQIVNAGNQSLATWQAKSCEIRIDANNSLTYYVQAGLVQVQQQVATVYTTLYSSLTYDSAVHKYFRLTESGGFIQAAHSTDNVSWTNYGAPFANPWAVTSLQLAISAGAYVAEASSTSAIVDNFEFGQTDLWPSSTQVGFTVQSGDALSGGTYYWRARAIDPFGSNTYGAWSATRTFTVTATPGIPHRIYRVNQAINRAGSF